MGPRTFAALVALTLAFPAAASAAASARTPEQRAASLVARMTPAERVDLVADGSAGVRRLGIPPLSATDGPHGVGESAAGVTAFPNEVSVGAAWDPSLARRFGAALGAEARAKGHTLLFAPTINIVRTPLWGRAAETLGEDPFLTSSLVAPLVRGIQSARVMAEPKHYVGNNQEIGRLGIPLGAPAVDDRISMRTLQEIYLPGFRAAVRQGGAASVMCSYNRVNGTPSCENPRTLGILRGLGLRGFVEPDALVAVRDTVAAARAGVDNFQIGSPATLRAAAAAGTVSPARIAQAARRILVGMIRAGVLDAPAPKERATAGTPAHRALATSIAAQGTVLLQNRRVRARRSRAAARVLPLTRADRSIAVIGHDAGAGTQIQVGGSAAVLPGAPVITPLAGIRGRAPRGSTVAYAPGTLGQVPLPVVPASALTPVSGSGHGLSGTFFASRAPNLVGFLGTGFMGPALGPRTDPGPPIGTRTDATLDAKNVLPAGAGSGRWTGTLTPPATGLYRFSLTVAGYATLRIGGRLVAWGDTEWVNLNRGAPDLSFHGHGTVRLTAGRSVPIVVEYAGDASFNGSELHLGWQPPAPSLLTRAVAAARRADVAVVFANDVTSEGMDRPSLWLPGDQDELIEAVAAVNPRTVVVLHTASAVLMPWRGKVAAIVEAWYPGQQSGRAIAATLWGDVDPSGRLPVSFPNHTWQGSTAGRQDRYPGIDNVAHYSEGLQVGYRAYGTRRERSPGSQPMFPFGFGLSYTSFSLGGLEVRGRGPRRYEVSVRVANTGRRAGAQVVQLYLRYPPAAGEPPRQLRAYAKVFLRPRAARRVRLALGPESFRMFDEARGAWRTVPGSYRISVGTSARDLPLSRSIRISR